MHCISSTFFIKFCIIDYHLLKAKKCTNTAPNNMFKQKTSMLWERYYWVVVCLPMLKRPLESREANRSSHIVRKMACALLQAFHRL
jgi:hypothetical protein